MCAYSDFRCLLSNFISTHVIYNFTSQNDEMTSTHLVIDWTKITHYGWRVIFSFYHMNNGAFRATSIALSCRHCCDVIRASLSRRLTSPDVTIIWWCLGGNHIYSSTIPLNEPVHHICHVCILHIVCPAMISLHWKIESAAGSALVAQWIEHHRLY